MLALCMHQNAALVAGLTLGPYEVTPKDEELAINVIQKASQLGATLINTADELTGWLGPGGQRLTAGFTPRTPAQPAACKNSGRALEELLIPACWTVALALTGASVCLACTPSCIAAKLTALLKRCSASTPLHCPAPSHTSACTALLEVLCSHMSYSRSAAHFYSGRINQTWR